MPVRPARAKAAPVAAPKREAILRAALEVFAEFGVHGVAVPEIAARAGVGTGTIYRFFVSKEALVNELFREQKHALARRLVQGLDESLEPRLLFREFWRRLVLFAREEPASFRFLELHDHHSYLDDESRALERRVLAPIVAATRALQKRGVYRKELRPEVIMTLHWGAFVQLFKAERAGQLTLRARDISATCDAVWRMCTYQMD
jgi:TetR/AcrR family transcriptional regulator, repressor of fatR-cypB operon